MIEIDDDNEDDQLEEDEVTEDNIGEDEPDAAESEEISSSDVLRMLFLPMRHQTRVIRSPLGNLEEEMARLFSNISFLRTSGNSGEL